MILSERPTVLIVVAEVVEVGVLQLRVEEISLENADLSLVLDQK